MTGLCRKIRREIREWLEAVLAAIPGAAGKKLRAAWFGLRLGALGAAAYLEQGIVVTGPKNIKLGNRFAMARGGALHAEDGEIIIGNDAAINCNVFISAADGGRIVIGNSVLIGPNTVLRASNHRTDDLTKPILAQGHTGGVITIADDVWIGANVVVTAGVAIGAHAVVGAGAVVTANVEPGTIVGGVPARKIRSRK